MKGIPSVMPGRKITDPIHRTAGLPGEINEQILPPPEKPIKGVVKC